MELRTELESRGRIVSFRVAITILLFDPPDYWSVCVYCLIADCFVMMSGNVGESSEYNCWRSRSLPILLYSESSGSASSPEELSIAEQEK